jgi:hypothetical protein
MDMLKTILGLNYGVPQPTGVINPDTVQVSNTGSDAPILSQEQIQRPAPYHQTGDPQVPRETYVDQNGNPIMYSGTSGGNNQNYAQNPGSNPNIGGMMNPNNTQPIGQNIGGNSGYNTPAFQNAQNNGFQNTPQGQPGVYNPPKGLFNITPTPQNIPGFNTLAPQYQSWLSTQQPFSALTPGQGTGTTNPNTGVVGPGHVTTGGGGGGVYTGPGNGNGNTGSTWIPSGTYGGNTGNTGNTGNGNGSGNSGNGDNNGSFGNGSYGDTSTNFVPTPGNDNNGSVTAGNLNPYTTDTNSVWDYTRTGLSILSALGNPNPYNLINAGNNAYKTWNRANTNIPQEGEANFNGPSQPNSYFPTTTDQGGDGQGGRSDGYNGGNDNGDPSTAEAPSEWDTGGGGAGCVHIASFLPEGNLAGSIEVGNSMILADERTLKPGTGIVSYSQEKTQPGFRIVTKNGVSLICSGSAPIPTKNGLKNPHELMGEKVATRKTTNGKIRNRWSKIVEVISIGFIQVQHITVGNKCFWAGETADGFILHHNMKMAEGEGGGGGGGGGTPFDIGRVEEDAKGGYISGPGTGTSDSIPAKLSNGEFVIPAAIVRALGRDYFEKMIKAKHR